MRGDCQYRGLAGGRNSVTHRSVANCTFTTIASASGDISVLSAGVVDRVQLPSDGDSIDIRIKPARGCNLYGSIVRIADVLTLPGSGCRTVDAADTEKWN